MSLSSNYNGFKPLLTAVAPFRTFPCDWFVCGGWAVDMFLDQRTREHQDVEVGVWRGDQKSLFDFLRDWDKCFIKSSQKHQWNEFQELALPAFQESKPESLLALECSEFL